MLPNRKPTRRAWETLLSEQKATCMLCRQTCRLINNCILSTDLLSTVLAGKFAGVSLRAVFDPWFGVFGIISPLISVGYKIQPPKPIPSLC